MATNFGTHTQHSSIPPIPFHTAAKIQESADSGIEARIEQLDDQINELSADSRVVWLKTGPHVYNAQFDLSVKVEAVRWMLRIAKHMQESAREAVFLRIENSLRQLERTVEASAWASVT
jgi:hypothetical protein